MKVNLGCGDKILNGWVNLDKYDLYSVDIIHDLEKFPYPFDDNTVDEIKLSHVLEHIGHHPDTFNKIIKEIYRICKNNSIISISVPHPRHDYFLNDPTHVRPITVPLLDLYNKEINEMWLSEGKANTPLGKIHNVDFRVDDVRYVVEEEILLKFNNGQINNEELEFYMKHYNNIIQQIEIKWRAVKNI